MQTRVLCKSSRHGLFADRQQMGARALDVRRPKMASTDAPPDRSIPPMRRPRPIRPEDHCVTVRCRCGHVGWVYLDAVRHLGDFRALGNALRCKGCGRKGWARLSGLRTKPEPPAPPPEHIPPSPYLRWEVNGEGWWYLRGCGSHVARVERRTGFHSAPGHGEWYWFGIGPDRGRCEWMTDAMDAAEQSVMRKGHPSDWDPAWRAPEPPPGVRPTLADARRYLRVVE